VIGGFGGVDTGSITRATGIYSHPNNLALFLERAFLLSLPMLAFRPWHPLLSLAIGAQIAGLFLTYSRGALLAVIVGIGITLVILGMRQKLRVMAGLTLVTGAVLFIAFRERLLDLGGSGSAPTRFAIWRSSVQMLIDHPLFGVGPDQFLYQYGLRYIEPSAWDERYTSHPHNVVLDVWLRLGAAGVGAFTALTFAVCQLVVRFRHRIRTDAIACGAIAALAGGLAHGQLDNGFFLPDLASMTWIAIAMIVTPGLESSTLASPKDGADEH
jgi:O-antigen ligase